jgi:CheY-like chemotaxis protein
MTITILVAEDHEPSRMLLLTRLQRRGYRIIEAADGAQAVALTVEQTPDLIVMDLSLPVMDGIEAWRTICELMPTPPPAIALTATTIQDVRLACSELGFADYITKPCDFAALVAAIERLALQRAVAS